MDTDQNVIDWSRDFLAEHSLGGPDPIMAQNMSSGASLGQDEVLWAEQYLDDVPTLQNTISNGPSLDPQEFQDFIASVGKESSTASTTGVLQGENTCSRLNIIECECDNLHLDNDWAEEFSQFTETDVALSNRCEV